MFKKGYKQSPEHIKKLRQTRLGRIAWNKGKTFVSKNYCFICEKPLSDRRSKTCRAHKVISEETKKKISLANRGRTPIWSKGAKLPQWIKNKMSIAAKIRIKKYPYTKPNKPFIAGHSVPLEWKQKFSKKVVSA